MVWLVVADEANKRSGPTGVEFSSERELEWM